MSEDLYRAARGELQTDGRTLLGLAVPYGRAATVTGDRDRPMPYREKFHRTAFSKFMKERGDRPVPLQVMHPWATGGNPEPLGPTHFTHGAEGLEFRARMSNTRAADEALELLNDGVYGDVSIGFRSIRHRDGRDAEGPYLERMEAYPFELSLAIVGTGVYEGAQVLAVRSRPSSPDLAPGEVETPRLEALRRRRGLLILP